MLCFICWFLEQKPGKIVWLLPCSDRLCLSEPCKGGTPSLSSLVQEEKGISGTEYIANVLEFVAVKYVDELLDYADVDKYIDVVSENNSYLVDNDSSMMKRCLLTCSL